MKVNNRVRSYGLVLAGAVSATVMWHVFGSAIAASNADTYKQLNLFGDVFDRVRADYVEDPDESKMIEAAINGMLASLDPHSSYMDAKRFEDMSVQTKGEFGGLGIEVTMENGVVKVVAPIDDTPAAKAGLMANDLIIKIDGTEIQGMTLNEAVDKMRGGGEYAHHPDHPAQGPGGLRCEAHPRPHPRAVGEVQYRRRRHRLCPHQLLHRADPGRPGEGLHQHEGKAGRQGQGLHHRSPEQSRRPPRPGHLGFRQLPRQGRSCLDPRPPRRGNPAVQRPEGRHLGRQDRGDPDQRRLGLGLGNCRRRPPGPQARHHHRHTGPSARARCRPSFRSAPRARCA